MTENCYGVDAKYAIPDKLWEEIGKLLPLPKPKKKAGRPRANDRQMMTAIFYEMRTGCQWQALPRSLGAHSTVHDRFQEWQAAGVFERLWQEGLYAYDEAKGIDWEWQAMDGAMTKAPLGGGKNRRQPDGPGQERNQAVSADRRAWCAYWPGRRRRQPPRHEADRRDVAVGGDRAA